jgi:hypothetical protein
MAEFNLGRRLWGVTKASLIAPFSAVTLPLFGAGEFAVLCAGRRIQAHVSYDERIL